MSTKAAGTAPIIGAATWAVRVRQSLNMVAGPFTVGSLPFVTTLVQSQIVNESLPIHYVLLYHHERLYRVAAWSGQYNGLPHAI